MEHWSEEQLKDATKMALLMTKVPTAKKERVETLIEGIIIGASMNTETEKETA